MEPFALVIFGGAGDLSRRLLIPSLYHTHRQGGFPAAAEIVGVGLPEMSDEAYRQLMEQALTDGTGGPLAAPVWQSFRNRLSFIGGDFGDPQTYRRLHERIQELSVRCGRNVIYYLAVPPSAMPAIVGQLDQLGLCRGQFHTKIIIEKPFGRDLASAIELNRLLLRAFDEPQIYRMDFYLGMATVRNLLNLRLANPPLAALWGAGQVDNVQISVAEKIGIGTRGAFYEETGAVRDMIQNHLLQILSLVAMEPPAGSGAEAVRDEKVKALMAVSPLRPAESVRGQYGAGALNGQRVTGYRQERDVDPASGRETYCAAKVTVNTPRWQGVPFYLRTGKRMSRELAEVNIKFRRPVTAPLAPGGPPSKPADFLYLSLFPGDRLGLCAFGEVEPGTGVPPDGGDSLSLAVSLGKEPPPPYAQLLFDIMQGDLTWFSRQDGIERLWSIVDPVIAAWEAGPPVDFPNYEAGSWGPVAAESLIRRDGREWLVTGEPQQPA